MNVNAPSSATLRLQDRRWPLLPFRKAIVVFVSAFLSLGLIWALRACAQSKFWGLAGACLLAAGVAVFSSLFVCVAFPAIALQSAITFVLLLGCGIVRASPKAVLPLSVAAMIASYGFFLYGAIGDLQKLSRIRDQFPLESISSRLAYESAARATLAPGDFASTASLLSPAVEQRLGAQEDRRTRSELPWRHNRRTMLASLHNRKSDQFALAQGFGRARMMPGFVSEQGLELPPAEPVSIPQEAELRDEPEYRNADALASSDSPAIPNRPPEDLLSFHESGVADFVDPDRIGYVQDRDHVAGFQSHRFTRIPEIGVPYSRPQSSWKLARLELVSLLKHDSPLVYDSPHLPQMDELRNAPTRPLDSFERESLVRLKSDEDVVTDESPERIRMIGSLRAARSCLECHSVERGALLGALTYELVPLRPTRKQESPQPVIN
jgi:hypothetical protein